MASLLTECLNTQQRNSQDSFVKEEIIISDCESLDETVQEKNIRNGVKSIKQLSNINKINLAPNSKEKLQFLPKKNIIKVKNQYKRTQILDLDAFHIKNISSLLQIKGLVDENEISSLEPFNSEPHEEKDFKISMATLDNNCSLLDIPDATEDSDKKITECWTISDSDSEKTNQVKAPILNSLESNKTLNVLKNTSTDACNSSTEIELGTQTAKNADTSNSITKKFKLTNASGEKKKLFYEVCLSCKKKQKRIMDVIVKNCQTCSASTCYQCILCSIPPYNSSSSIYMHIIRSHQKETKNIERVKCPRCDRWYLIGTKFHDHLRRCKVEPHLQCPICKIKKFHRKHYLKCHMIACHFNDVSKLNIEKLLDDVANNSEHLRVKAQRKAELHYGGKYRRPFPLNEYINGYCPKCDELFSPQPEGIIMKNCENCSSQLILQCTKCEKRCFTRNNMRLHLITKCVKQSYDRILYCNDCEFSAPHKNILRTHIFRLHLGQDPNNRYKCKKCNKTFKVIYDCTYHEKNCGIVKMHMCDECSYTTKYRYRYLNHVRRHLRLGSVSARTKYDNTVDKVIDSCIHKTTKNIVKPESKVNKIKNFITRSMVAYCPHCKIEIPHFRQKPMCSNKNCDKGEFVYRCKYCSYKHLDMSLVRTHVVRCHLEEVYNCPNNCGTKFSNTLDLNKHTEICDKVFRCQYCSYVATCMDRIRNHIQLRNCVEYEKLRGNVINKLVNPTPGNDDEDVKEIDVEDPLRIIEREKFRKMTSFKTSVKPTRIKNIKLNSRPLDFQFCSQKLLKCSNCPKLYRNKAKLSLHESTCGHIKELFYCDHCSYKTNVKTSLENHILSKHAARLFRDVNAFRCEHCLKVFRNYFIYFKHTENCRYR